MPLTIDGLTIHKVLIVDDDAAARDSFDYALEELGIEPVLQNEPLRGNPYEMLPQLRKKADAMISDYHLTKKGNYSPFDGDQLVAAANTQQFPSLLWTSYTDAALTMPRKLKRHIPVLLTSDDDSDSDPETVTQSLRQCISEAKGVFDPTRRPWRSLVRIEDIEPEHGYFHVVIPGWGSGQKVRISLNELPENIQRRIVPGNRMHAKVNRGAKKPEDLFFDDWEEK